MWIKSDRVVDAVIYLFLIFALSYLILSARGAQQAPLPLQAPLLSEAPIPPQAPDVQDDTQLEPLPMPKSDPVSRPWLSPEPFPEGAVLYVGTRWTQSIYVLNGQDRIDRVALSGTDPKWHQSGGMLGVKGWKSDKYRLIPAGKSIETWVDTIRVLNQYGFTQPNRGLVRRYPDGSRLDDVLSKDGVVFEHRVATKTDGKWKREVIYEDKSARPDGYHGLSVSCASCHRLAGSGGYATGLVPGGDSVLGDPLRWAALGKR